MLSVAGKCLDREYLPRMWVRLRQSNLPFRGRYVAAQVPGRMLATAHAVAYFIPEHARDVPACVGGTVGQYRYLRGRSPSFASASNAMAS